MVAMLEVSSEIYFLDFSLTLSKAVTRLSKSWLRVWAIGEGKGQVGPHRKGVTSEGYHDDQYKERKSMG